LAVASPGKWKKLIIVSFCAFGALLTFYLNYLYGTSLLSVSSLVKTSSFADHGLSLPKVINNLADNISSSGNVIRISVVLILLLLISIKWRSLVALDECIHCDSITLRERSKLRLSLFSSISFLIFHLLFSHLRDWYFASTIFSLLYIFDYIHGGSVARGRQRSSVDFVLFVLAASIVAFSILYFSLNIGSRILTSRFVDESISLLPEGSRVYVFDGSGFLGWRLSEANISVVNGDGLVNSYQYFKAVKGSCSDFIDYIQSNKINYFITNDGNSNPQNFGNTDRRLGANCTGKNFRVVRIVGPATDKQYLKYQLFQILPSRNYV